MAYDPLFDSEENKALVAICTRKLIRNIGIGGIIWGVINVGIGIAAVQEAPINVGILILGVLMLGTGIQALARPTLGVLLTETIVTVLLVAWNVGMFFINRGEGAPTDPRGFLFPLIISVVFANN